MSSDLGTPLDLYCERASAAFWAEPVNALTNLSFIAAAFGLLHLIRRERLRLDPAGSFLVANVALIGIGSFLFHTLANRWTLVADVLPIFIYQIAFVGLYARRVSRQPVAVVAGLVLLYLALSFAFASLPRAWLNGSLAYGSALVFIAGIGLHHLRAGRRDAWGVLAAFAVLLLSLFFRSIDQQVCPHAALGTHFLWHLLNGLVLYLTTRAYLLNALPAAPSQPR
ncbi:ceramidase domain-containing protein [Thauera sp. SDU_THAU2]|uniref:ceramidase domain-containing protein n=1 Tax=Thauera sp. SDU_THAU2 TaxID=3136633 RepID=UPI00311EBC96